jgi:hypothetical protein
MKQRDYIVPKRRNIANVYKGKNGVKNQKWRFCPTAQSQKTVQFLSVTENK